MHSLSLCVGVNGIRQHLATLLTLAFVASPLALISMVPSVAALSEISACSLAPCDLATDPTVLAQLAADSAEMANCPGGPWREIAIYWGNGNSYITYWDNWFGHVRANWRLSANTVIGGIDDWVLSAGVRELDGDWQAFAPSISNSNSCVYVGTVTPGTAVQFSHDGGGVAYSSSFGTYCENTYSVQRTAKVEVKIGIKIKDAGSTTSYEKSVGQSQTCGSHSDATMDSESLLRTTVSGPRTTSSCDALTIVTVPDPSGWGTDYYAVVWAQGCPPDGNPDAGIYQECNGIAGLQYWSDCVIVRT